MRILPANRWARALSIVALLALYSALMWWYVFPWFDRTYVNRPVFEGTPASPRPTATSSPSPTATVSPP